MGRYERSLYARIAAGEDVAFQALIEPYRYQLARFVDRQLAGDTRAVDGVLQETYIAPKREQTPSRSIFQAPKPQEPLFGAATDKAIADASLTAR